MAQPSNTYDTYDLVGGREDLMDIITKITPTDNPFPSSTLSKRLQSNKKKRTHRGKR